MQYESEESTDYFDLPNDLLYLLLKYKISQRAIYEIGGYKYKPLAIEIIKSIADKYNEKLLGMDWRKE